MTTNKISLPLLLGGAAIFLAAGAGGMYVFLRSANQRPMDTSHAIVTPEAPQEIAVSLTPDAIERAGIRTAKPVRGQTGTAMTLPGIVEPNAYRQVVVRSVAAGQVRTVTADLGATVKHGDVLATIHTPDLAEAARMYLSMRSEFDTAHQRLMRLEPLVKIGAASQQELEAATAEHTRHATDVESARSKLILLGMTANQVTSLTESSPVDSLARITAPADGQIAARSINPGMNIDASTDLFTIVDLDSVWVVADVYEQDLSRVRLGTDATITAASASERTWTGRLSYIDPRLAPETRAAKARIEINNPGHLLRLGMYVDVTLAGAASATAMLVPRSALQTIGSQTVIYVRDQSHPGRFVERPVAVRPASNGQLEIVTGIAETDDIVIDGSFALRAERDRLGLPAPAAGPIPSEHSQSVSPAAAQVVDIAITKNGFVPDTVTVKADVPIDLTFIRKTDDTCAKEVVVPSIKARQALPLNEKVVIRLPASKAGTIAFACGMDMLKGTIVVR